MTMDDAAPHADNFVTATGNEDVITLDHMRAMKDRAIVCNIGHFDFRNSDRRVAQPEMGRSETASGRSCVRRTASA